MAGLEGALLHMNYFRFGNEIAAVAYESDRMTTAYYAVEMFLPEWLVTMEIPQGEYVGYDK